MKLSAREIDGFLKHPPAHYSGALIYGPDHGLVAQRAAQLARAIAPDLNDPFNVTLLDGEHSDSDSLADAAHMLSLSTAKRLIWLRNASDHATKAVEAVFKESGAAASNGNFFLVIDAGDLGPRSPLRKLCEGQQMCGVIACYVEDIAPLAQAAQRLLADAGWQLEREAAFYLAQQIAGDYALARGEIDKLITYLGKPAARGAPIGRDVIGAIIGDGGAAALDDVAEACFTRQPQSLLRVLDQALKDGAAAVAIIRSLLRHAARLYQVQIAVAAGHSRDDAIGKLAPPLFFKRKDSFAAQLQKWPAASLERAMARLAQLEGEVKQTMFDDETLLRQALLQLTGGGRNR